MDTRTQKHGRQENGNRKIAVLVVVAVALVLVAGGFVWYGWFRPVAVALEPASVALLPGERYSLTPKIQPEREDITLSYASSDLAVATIDDMGNITAVGPGACEVRVWPAGNEDSSAVCKVIVEQPAEPQEEPSPVPALHPPDGDGGPAMYIPEEITAASVPEDKEATIMLTGDLMCLSAQISSAKSGDGYDFTPGFAPVQDIFARADYVAGNLETTVASSFPYAQPNPATPAPAEPVEGGEPQPAATRYIPTLNAPDAYLVALQGAGFDAVSTAGNHCCDTGAQGITETIAALDAHGIAYTGTFAVPDAPRFLLADVNGIQVAFLSYSEFFNGKEGSLTSEQRAYMINPYSEERMAADVAAAKEAGAQFIIAYMHWGTENKQTVDQSQRDHARVLANAGVNVIAGAHPHCLQEAEYITADDGRAVLCLYSLGNFISSMAQQMHNDTAIVELDIRYNGTDTFLESAGYIPCRVSDHQGKSFVVQPVAPDGEAAARISGALGGALEMRTAQPE